MRGNAFIADCGSNLIHRKRLLRDRIGRTAERPPGEERIEFVASTDNWFRPVQFANAPDGTLYVADMYREFIEHPWSLPASLKKLMDLNSGSDRGRIYRIIPEDYQQPKPISLGALPTKRLVALLEHANGWHRDTAARLIFERQDRGIVRDVERLLEKSLFPKGRLHALYALSGLGVLSEKHVYLALGDGDAELRRHAARLSESLSSLDSRQKGAETVATRLAGLANDPEPSVRYQAAFTYGSLALPNRATLLATIAARDAQDPWVRLAILTSAREVAAELLALAAPDRGLASSGGGREFVRQLAQVVGARNQMEEIRASARKMSELGDAGEVFAGADALWTGAEGSGGDRARLFELFQPVRERARAAIPNSKLAEPVRLGAIRIAARGPESEFKPALLDLISPGQSDELQSAALTSLVALGRGSLEAVLGAWGRLTPRQHQGVIEAALKRNETIVVLAVALENRSLRKGDFTPAQWDRFARSTDTSVRAAIARSSESENKGSRADVLQRYLASAQAVGDVGKGKAIFLQRCLVCHRSGGEGGNVGPDLASVRANGKEVLLRNIVDPNLVVAPQFAAYEVLKKNDETLVGVIASEGESSLILRGADGKDITLPRAQIQSVRGLGQSLMPEGLEEGLSVSEMADLLEFLTHGP